MLIREKKEKAFFQMKLNNFNSRIKQRKIILKYND